jgi:hypothetical protein
MTEQEQFEVWKSKVDLYLVSMVKKSSEDFHIQYDFLQDFKDRVPPSETAMRIIRLSYRR